MSNELFTQLNGWSVVLLDWVLSAIILGTLLAIATWALVRFALRRSTLPLISLFWILVLVKFLVPFGPAWSLSATSLAQAWIPDLTSPIAKPTEGVANGELELEVLPIAALPTETAPDAEQSAVSDSTALVRPTIVGLALAYVVLLVLIGGWRIRAYQRFRDRCRALPRCEGAALAVVEHVCARAGLKRTPDVRLSNDAPAPFILGMFRPLLVLSHRQLGNAVELEAVVLHEVAHLRRGDLFVRYLQWLAGTAFFFWPVVAWVNRQIDLAREHACDEWALRRSRLTSSAYARCLLRAVHPATDMSTAYTPAAMASNPNHVERRIDMILNLSAPTRSWLGRGLASGLLLGWGAFMLTGAVPASDPQAASDNESETPQNVFVWKSSDGDAAPSFVSGRRTAIMFTDDSGSPSMPLMIRAGHSGNLDAFRENHPTSDADGDGRTSSQERNAYLVSLAMGAPERVIEQFPYADHNDDGVLQAQEAARLTGGMPLRHRAQLHDHLNVVGIGVHADEIHAGVGANVEHRAHFIRRVTENETPEVTSFDVVAETADGSQKPMKVVLRSKAVWTADEPIAAKVADAVSEFRFVASPSQWLLANVEGTPTAEEVASFVPVVEEAENASFLEMMPQADADGDGTLTAEEREAYMNDQRLRMNKHLMEVHPEIDTDGDGDLSKEELREFFNSQIDAVRGDHDADFQTHLHEVLEKHANTTIADKVRTLVIRAGQAAIQDAVDEHRNADADSEK